MDNLTPQQRRKNMQHIKSKDTSIEIKFRKALWQKGYRYRKNYKGLPGKPDIVLTKEKIAIFCGGHRSAKHKAAGFRVFMVRRAGGAC